MDYTDQTPENSTASSSRIMLKLPEVKPYVTYILLGITVLIFIFQLGTEYLLQTDYLVLYGAKINQMIAQGELWRLFTPMFLHGSILHIAFNMYALSKIGPRLERYYGHWRFLALYILSGFGGNVFSMMFTDAPSLGSSTAIFGLIGAQGVFYYHNREIFGTAFRQALNGIITIAAFNLVIGLSPGIDNWGHIGGLIGGIIFAWLSGPILDVVGVYPDLSLDDRRGTIEVYQGIGVTAGFFSLLTAGALYLMI
jgi:rhomboid protease GluP